MAETVRKISADLADGEQGIAGPRAGMADPAEAMRWRIVDTAERLYRQYGYQKTTVADIAAELGMSPANIYRFFASKATITEAVLVKATTEIAEQARAIAADQRLSAAARLRQMVQTCYRATSQRCIADNRLHAMVHAAIDENWEVIGRHKTTMRAITAAIIADGVAAGEFHGADAELAAHCFQISMVAFFHPVLIERCLQAGEDMDAMLEPMLDFALRGLAAGKS